MNTLQKMKMIGQKPDFHFTVEHVDKKHNHQMVVSASNNEVKSLKSIF